MWSPDSGPDSASHRAPGAPGRRARAIVALIAACALTSACTVRPLYSDAIAPGASAPVAARLASVSVKPVGTREAQEVRNQLIFLLAGGQGNPEAGTYTLDLTVTSFSSAAAVVQVSTTTQSPTSSLLTMTGLYRLVESATGRVVATGRRQISSAYDVPTQQFAALRSQRDAENRAARELAELLHLAIAQDLSKGS
jgi:LPS-assembly lipoprotein